MWRDLSVFLAGMAALLLFAAFVGGMKRFEAALGEVDALSLLADDAQGNAGCGLRKTVVT